MSGNSMDVTNMVWQPPLLKLTRVPHPDLVGQATATFIRPDLVATIQSSWVNLKRIDSEKERHPPMMCTCIFLTTGGHLFVMEEPDAVALLRDRALGHQKGPRAVP
jgi:hypothetical protein